MIDIVEASSIRPGIYFDTQRHRVDPFATYVVLREYYPVCQLEPTGVWAVSRYDDVKFALQRRDLFSSCGFEVLHNLENIPDACKLAFFRQSQDPPEYKLYDTLANNVFARDYVRSLTSYIRQTVQILTVGLRHKVNPEFVADFVAPCTRAVMARAIGVDSPSAMDDIGNHAEMLEILQSGVSSSDGINAINKAIRQQNYFYGSLIRDRRHSPCRDLVTILINCRTGEGSGYSDGELRHALGMFVAQGLQACMHVLVRSIRFLARNPLVHKVLADETDRIPSFVEEMLRYDSPVHGLLHRTRKAVTLNGVTIPKNELVLLLPASANRDPSHFADPDNFHMWRDNLDDCLGFSHGKDVNLGAELARLELIIALEEIVSTFSRIECPPDGELKWNGGLTHNGVGELPARFVLA